MELALRYLRPSTLDTNCEEAASRALNGCLTGWYAPQNCTGISAAAFFVGLAVGGGLVTALGCFAGGVYFFCQRRQSVPAARAPPRRRALN